MFIIYNTKLLLGIIITFFFLYAYIPYNVQALSMILDLFHI